MSDQPNPKPDADSAPRLDMRTRDPDGPIDLETKRFDIFLIDTGWNRPISKTVRSHLRLLFEFHRRDSLYELTPQQSLEILKHDPALLGCDPTIIVYDHYGCSLTDAGSYCGFRLNLGLMRNAEQALARLQEFIRFIATNRTAERLDREVRRELHREGLEGIVKLLRETSTELLID